MPRPSHPRWITLSMAALVVVMALIAPVRTWLSAGTLTATTASRDALPAGLRDICRAFGLSLSANAVVPAASADIGVDAPTPMLDATPHCPWCRVDTLPLWLPLAWWLLIFGRAPPRRVPPPWGATPSYHPIEPGTLALSRAPPATRSPRFA